MSNKQSYKLNYATRVFQQYFNSLGSLCFYYTQIESKMLEIMVILKYHLDQPNNIVKYQNRVLRDGLSVKMDKVYKLIERYNSSLNDEYKTTFDECHNLRKTRDKLAHWQIMVKEEPTENEEVIKIKLKQIGYFTKEQDFHSQELSHLVNNAHGIIESLDSLVELLREDLKKFLP